MLLSKMFPESNSSRVMRQSMKRKIILVLLNSLVFAAFLLCFAMWSMPGTFNMRIIPTLQEINAMRIITSASDTCDGASLVHPSVSRHPIYPIPAVVREDKFTIIINTYKRTPLLIKSIEHYSQMAKVDKIVVYWSNVGVQPPDLQEYSVPGVPVVIKFMERIDLSLRFSPSDAIETLGVFNVDDDLIIKEEDVNHAFYVWKYHPHGLVGFTPRTHKQSGDGNFNYYRLPLFVGNYSLILTNAAFMHKHYLTIFDKELPKGMKNFIDENTNCEDIAMNFIVNHHCKCAGIFYVKPKHAIKDGGSSLGLSRRGKHAEIRDTCVGLLTKIYPDAHLKWVSCRY